MTVEPQIVRVKRCLGCGAQETMGLGFVSPPDSKGLQLQIEMCLQCVRALDRVAWDARHTLDDYGPCPPCGVHYGRDNPCRFRRIKCVRCQVDDIAFVGRQTDHYDLPRGFRVIIDALGYHAGFVCAYCADRLEPIPGSASTDRER